MNYKDLTIEELDIIHNKGFDVVCDGDNKILYINSIIEIMNKIYKFIKPIVENIINCITEIGETRKELWYKFKFYKKHLKLVYKRKYQKLKKGKRYVHLVRKC